MTTRKERPLWSDVLLLLSKLYGNSLSCSMKSDINMIKKLEQICLKTSEKGKYAWLQHRP